MANARTTLLIVDGEVFFSAHLDNDGIRVGIKGVRHIDVPRTHKLFEEASRAVTEEACEEFLGRHCH